MDSRVRYEVCPECGFDNTEKKGACPVCDNRLFSDDEEEHQRYVLLIMSEHQKRSMLWFGGWAIVLLIFVGPMLLLATGKIGWAPGGGALIGTLFLGWRLVDLKKKREASGLFLAKHKMPGKKSGRQID